MNVAFSWSSPTDVLTVVVLGGALLFMAGLFIAAAVKDRRGRGDGPDSDAVADAVEQGRRQGRVDWPEGMGRWLD